jgi:hypothetical protein
MRAYPRVAYPPSRTPPPPDPRTTRALETLRRVGVVLESGHWPSGHTLEPHDRSAITRTIARLELELPTSERGFS